METLDLHGQPFDPDFTLACGQAFRWRKLADGVWRGVVRDRLLELKTEGGKLLWRTYPEHDEALVRDYLRLSDDVNDIYARLSQADSHLARLVQRFRGLRLLRQDPVETLLSFVCSAANSIPRISAAIETLSMLYGDLICELPGRAASEDHAESAPRCYYSFPTVERLAEADPVALAETHSLEFRGSNLKLVAGQLLDRGENWLVSLRRVPYQEARDELLTIRGVGRKIADCVCLFSLDKDEAVPVDTHVRQLARRLWMPDLAGKSLTDAVYRRIADAFAERYGPLAGWAQQFLFYEDLLRTPGRDISRRHSLDTPLYGG